MKLSVIIPVYNVEEYIDKCINSVLEQTFNDYEIIIINDGSKDRSIDIVKKYNDSRIRIINKKNGGLSSARNVGIDNALGKYILFIDSDDFIIFKYAFKEIIEQIERENADILVGNALAYYSKNKNFPLKRNKSVFIKSTMNNINFLIKFLEAKSMFSPVWLNLYKRELFADGLRFKEGILHEDEEFTPRVFLKANTITIYNKEFYGYRQRDGSIMNKKDKRKNSEDLRKTCFELENVYKGIKNENLRYLFLDYIAALLYHSIKIGNRKPSKAEKDFVYKNAYTFKNKIKGILLKFNLCF